MKPSDYADMEETLRALEVLRERKINSDRYLRLLKRIGYAFSAAAIVVGIPLGFVVIGGMIEGQIGFWPIFFAFPYVGVVYLVFRGMYPKNHMAASYLSHHFGYRRSDAEILDEQIADYEARLNVLRGKGSD